MRDDEVLQRVVTWTGTPSLPASADRLHCSSTPGRFFFSIYYGSTTKHPLFGGFESREVS